MKKRSIYGLIAALLIAMAGVAASGCSDNLNKEYEPISSVNRMVLINGSPRDTTINLTAAGGKRGITIESNTRWTVQIEKGGGWCSTDLLSGSGKESFTITVLENQGEDERRCTIEISAIDAEGQQDSNKALTKTITIIQSKSDVRIYPSSLETFPAKESDHSFEIIANTPWKLEVAYENASTQHFLTVTPGENMQNIAENMFEGSGDARFTLHIATNRTDASRLAFLNLTTDGNVGSYSVEIRQNRSEFTFSVSAEKHTVDPQGGELTFGVLSHSPWTVSSSDATTSFNPASGQGTGQLETTIAKFSPNMTDTVRTIKIHFLPENENYIPEDITITQQPFTMTFKVSPGSLPGVIEDVEGGTYTINVNSMFDWEIAKESDWLTVTPNKGVQSKDAVTLEVNVDKNITNSQRDDVITVVPLPTEFYSGVTIDPKDVCVGPISIPIKQYGGQKPAISIPWVGDGITQREAVLKFNYYSPYIEILGAGLEWRVAGSSSWTSIPVEISNEHSGTVTVTLTSLNPVTDYEARGYVVGSDGETYQGTATETFKTAGRYPDPSDNPFPTR